MPSPKKTFPRVRILVVDDESGPRNLLKESLSLKGYHVNTAKTGEKACQLIDEASFDLVITDLNMPGLSGIELLNKIRQLSPETHVIIITGYASLRSAIDAIRGGAYDYLTKPFQIDELYVVVNNAVERIKLIKENNELLAKLKMTSKKMEAFLSTDILEGSDLSGNLDFLHDLHKRLLTVYTRSSSTGQP